MTYRPQNVCKQCRYTWHPRGKDLSRRCPNCGSNDIRFGCGGCGCALIVIGLVVGLAILGTILRVAGLVPQVHTSSTPLSATSSPKAGTESPESEKRPNSPVSKTEDTGRVILKSAIPVGKNVEAWAEVDGKRYEWGVGLRELELVLASGKHRMAVRLIERRGSTVVQSRTIFDKNVEVVAGTLITLDMPTK
jgi:hypothetical protein